MPSAISIPFDPSAMFADAICVGNKLAAGFPGTSALGRAFREAELPVLANSVEKLLSRVAPIFELN
jgi:hypothetical protein